MAEYERSRSRGRKDVFVIGADPYNLDLIRQIPGADDWRLIPTLERDDVQPPSGRTNFNELYEGARKIIDDHGGAPDAIIGYLDFPATSLLSLLNRDFNMPGASPEAVARCEHKYWMRLEQERLFPGSTPAVSALNPFAPEEAKENAPEYPFWLKPVKGHSSLLGFMIEDEKDFDKALHECRQKIHLLGRAFNQFLAHVEDKDKIGEIDGNYAVAESLISAERQFTLEGYVWNGETVVYGAIDSIREGRYKSSFSRYQYPAELPREIVDEATSVISGFLSGVHYDNSPFNAEFFWDPETGALRLLEINPRISKSHSPLFHMVDGASHHKIAIDLSLGRRPDMPRGEGKDNVAAKFMLRSFEADGIVKRVPNDDEIKELKRILPDIDVNLLVEKNLRLSTLFYQDSYSFELADVFLGGANEEMLEDAYARCIDSLPIHIKPLPAPK